MVLKERRRIKDSTHVDSVGARPNFKKKAVRRRWITMFILSLAGDGWSYESTVMAAILSLPLYVSHLGYPENQYLPDGINQWLGPVYTLGQLFGGLFAAFLGDFYGRKTLMWQGAIQIDISIALLIWSPNPATVIVARIVEGISIGFLLIGYQIISAEMSARNERGFFGGLSLITGNVFGLIASAITYGVLYADGNWGWRLSLGITFIPATLLIVAIPFLPESPRWLYQKGRVDEAYKVMEFLHGDVAEDGTVQLSPEMKLEWQEMKAAIDYDIQTKANSWKNFFNTPAARYRSFVALSSQFIWAWNGQSVFTYYYTYVFESVGFTDARVQFAFNSGLSASFIIGSTIGSYMLDVTGRKISLLIGVGQMALTLFVQGGLSVGYFDKGLTNHAAGAVFVTLYFLQWMLWVSFFSPVVNMYPAELYPAPLRMRGYAMTNVLSMASGFVAQYTGKPMYNKMNGWVWIFFGFCMLVAAIGIAIYYPETKNLTLEEIEAVFETGAGKALKKRAAKVLEEADESGDTKPKLTPGFERIGELPNAEENSRHNTSGKEDVIHHTTSATSSK